MTPIAPIVPLTPPQVKALIAVKNGRVRRESSLLQSWAIKGTAHVSLRSLVILHRRGLIRIVNGQVELAPEAHEILYQLGKLPKRERSAGSAATASKT